VNISDPNGINIAGSVKSTILRTGVGGDEESLFSNGVTLATDAILIVFIGDEPI
jgi:hypothetical protein